MSCSRALSSRWTDLNDARIQDDFWLADKNLIVLSTLLQWRVDSNLCCTQLFDNNFRLCQPNVIFHLIAYTLPTSPKIYMSYHKIRLVSYTK